MTQPAALMGELAQSLARSGQDRRDDMLIKFAQLFEGVSHLLDNGGVETFDSIFVSLVPTCSEEARKVLADAVAPNERAPVRLIRQLAFDDSILVARPVIRLSPLLLDEHLLALATVKSPEHLLAICERSSLNAGVTDIILSRANGEILIAVARLDAPDEAPRHGAAWGPPPVVPAASAPPVLPTPAPVDRTPAFDLELRDLLAKRSVDAAIGALADKVAVPPHAVAKAFALDVHGGFLAYARAVPLAWETVLRFLMARYEAGQVIPRLQRAEADYARLQVSEARRVASLLGMHSGKSH
ncbi:MAG: DUF2336 domain-containing protein [Beijerinckiaceae bacterium]|nr:DUF2336 domain-containing protein [Beijerinckiaceae bacterium]